MNNILQYIMTGKEAKIQTTRDRVRSLIYKNIEHRLQGSEIMWQWRLAYDVSILNWMRSALPRSLFTRVLEIIQRGRRSAVLRGHTVSQSRLNMYVPFVQSQPWAQEFLFPRISCIRGSRIFLPVLYSTFRFVWVWTVARRATFQA